MIANDVLDRLNVINENLISNFGEGNVDLRNLMRDFLVDVPFSDVENRVIEIATGVPGIMRIPLELVRGANGGIHGDMNHPFMSFFFPNQDVPTLVHLGGQNVSYDLFTRAYSRLVQLAANIPQEAATWSLEGIGAYIALASVSLLTLSLFLTMPFYAGKEAYEGDTFIEELTDIERTYDPLNPDKTLKYTFNEDDELTEEQIREFLQRKIALEENNNNDNNNKISTNNSAIIFVILILFVVATK